MKYLQLFLLCLFISGFTKAQTLDSAPWCPPGATWVYKLGSAFGSIDYVEAKYIKDTFLLGINVKKIEIKDISYSFNSPGIWVRNEQISGSEFEYLSNDSLYYYDPINNNFAYLYSFNLANGDSLILSNSRAVCNNNNNYPTSDTVYITGLQLDTFDNIIFETTTINDQCMNCFFSIGNKIFKNIGSTIRMPMISGNFCTFPFPDYGSLICYGDSLRGNITFSQNLFPADNCGGLISETIKIEERKIFDNQILLFPNPTSDLLWIKCNFDYNILNIEIFEHSGKKILTEKTKNGIIDVSPLNTGLYIIKISYNKNYLFSKFVKK